MENIGYIVIILGFVIAFIKSPIFDKIKNDDNAENDSQSSITNFPYKKKMLLTKTEYSFYRILKTECDKRNFLICPKVRMEDFLDVTCKDQKLKYRGYIKSRHIDFMICDNKLHMLCGIELDDNTHNNEKAQKTDNFKDEVFKVIQMPLYRVKVSDKNYEEQLNTIFNNFEVKHGEIPLETDK